MTCLKTSKAVLWRVDDETMGKRMLSGTSAIFDAIADMSELVEPPVDIILTRSSTADDDGSFRLSW